MIFVLGMFSERIFVLYLVILLMKFWGKVSEGIFGYCFSDSNVVFIKVLHFALRYGFLTLWRFVELASLLLLARSWVLRPVLKLFLSLRRFFVKCASWDRVFKIWSLTSKLNEETLMIVFECFYFAQNLWSLNA